MAGTLLVVHTSDGRPYAELPDCDQLLWFNSKDRYLLIEDPSEDGNGTAQESLNCVLLEEQEIGGVQKVTEFTLDRYDHEDEAEILDVRRSMEGRIADREDGTDDSPTATVLWSERTGAGNSFGQVYVIEYRGDEGSEGEETSFSFRGEFLANNVVVSFTDFPRFGEDELIEGDLDRLVSLNDDLEEQLRSEGEFA